MRIPRALIPLVASFFQLVLADCGGDSTQPTAADVSGTYVVVTQTSAPVCDPSAALQVLGPVLGFEPLRFTLRVEQFDGQVRITPVSAETLDGRPVTIADPRPRLVPMSSDGAIQIETDVSDQFRLGGRTYFHHLTGVGTGGFERTANPITLSTTGTLTEVIREGSADAPVFATCSETQTMSGSRTGA
jgi:hypothetical protein